MNTIEIYNIIDLEYQDWIDVGFGKWIHGIFLRGGDKVFTFDEQKESFFYLLKKLLDDNKVVLFAPYSMFNENTSQWDKTVAIRKYGDTIWGLPSKEIIQYMRDVFPKDAKDENDDKVYDFWFSEDCPQIGWVDKKTGEIVAS
ncbi:hypothetical protein [uncultured Gammaproteobacteria bacterium]|jgi:hypothetical protein|nr:hypothetical protein [uncultured Gammaproteobacteria bacterium]CAC9490786.1 hypothetical protein [uncultured Gammaproteobacteria bacterium]CAC9997310.1 hypothetical protein [uncultured Gammaproteobacteria bacterium]CAC9997708.1 hypothetical protein [uncultured Gammaproteobacteria bacterium]VVH56603.1 hypothetical protein BAZOLSSOX_2094 [uncultured Gammaproteobacteria bacterium]